MAIETRSFDYNIESETFRGHLAAPGPVAHPGVLVFHAWAGRSQFENQKAEALAHLGFTAIAIDLFGKDVLGSSKEENQKLIEPFVNDRLLLRKRLLANLEMARSLEEIDSNQIAAIGFCFGGLCVLDLARSGADLAGVVSFHGLLGAPVGGQEKIRAKVLALHGWDDPMAPPEDVMALTKELTAGGADWQLHAYGGVKHAFTNPEANDPGFGTVYDADADRRSWNAMRTFLDEIL